MTVKLLKFEEALPALKEGKKLTRANWNGNNLTATLKANIADFKAGMWIVMMPELVLPSFNTQDTMRKVNDRTAKHIGEDTPLDSQPYISLFTPDKKWQPGWVCSQADLFAVDWIVLED